MSAVTYRGQNRKAGNAPKTLLERPLSRCMVIMLFLGLLVLPASIPFRVVLLAGGALVWTWLEARNLKPIGLGRKRPGLTLLWGVGIAVAVTAFGEIVQPVIERAFGMQSDYSGYGALAGNAEAALRLLAFALVSAAIGEEILFRGFLLHQLSGVLGDGSAARWITIVTGGVIFGLAHAIQGPLGVLNTGLVGIIFGWAWFRSGRNLWALILAHALVDTYGIGMLYLGRYA
ncbi:membrane protease YdiL (CAAX protease family) [Novosphingobium chloroacetimidivorans]|uniref:Membrane protease YdiL (CAAX protease family) n=1 Tax=Novosphingobium chloroacetimidivorans TaxID=1428314 RepID=A0A7W7KAJ4_9SPHN|nr:type II CAAX endopeptidase family protein [Novosphingobium chloroacetimidivorans]MBB4858729.1 membrane protease YdiL (CAAX protease family) [Novosphingobium chloroacetimidivorans]